MMPLLVSIDKRKALKNIPSINRKFGMRGWFDDSYRHSLSAMGVKTGRKSPKNNLNFFALKKGTSVGEGAVSQHRAEHDLLYDSHISQKEFSDIGAIAVQQHRAEHQKLPKPKKKYQQMKTGTALLVGGVGGALITAHVMKNRPKPKPKKFQVLRVKDSDDSQFKNIVESEGIRRKRLALIEDLDNKITPLISEKISKGKDFDKQEMLNSHIEKQNELIDEQQQEEHIEVNKKPKKYMAYNPAYVSGDLPLIAGDAIGTAGAAVVPLIPVAVAAGAIYGGAVLSKKAYDKAKGKKSKPKKKKSKSKKYRAPKPTINTVAGEAKFLKTETESPGGEWGQDQYTTKEGFWVIHEGDKHHVYKV